MRIQVFSDLHADVRPPRQPLSRPDVDCVVVAGDVCAGADAGMATIRRCVPMHVPVIAVMGNHEYYGECLPEVLAEGRRSAPLHGIHLGENDIVVVGDARFLTCTLWTDYALYGEATRARAMDLARYTINDHRRILWSRSPRFPFRPNEAAMLHAESRRFLSDALAEPFDGPTVVVSHHAPLPQSLDPRFGTTLVNAAFASDLFGLIGNDGPALWIHGHIHRSADYVVGRTRIVCNPHGYGGENPAFDPCMIVEIGGAA